MAFIDLTGASELINRSALHEVEVSDTRASVYSNVNTSQKWRI